MRVGDGGRRTEHILAAVIADGTHSRGPENVDVIKRTREDCLSLEAVSSASPSPSQTFDGVTLNH